MLFIFTLVAAILLLATHFAYLGSCAYPILSHLLQYRTGPLDSKLYLQYFSIKLSYFLKFVFVHG